MASDAPVRNPGRPLQGREGIEERLPHRAPFLFVDRILSEEDGVVVGEWDVPPDLDAFAGHFPGEPVLPGVLISEHAFQIAALAILTAGEPLQGTPVLTRIEDARFRRRVAPGDTLTTRAEIRESLGNARWCRARVARGEETVAKLSFVLALAPLEQAPPEEARS